MCTEKNVLAKKKKKKKKNFTNELKIGLSVLLGIEKTVHGGETHILSSKKIFRAHR